VTERCRRLLAALLSFASGGACADAALDACNASTHATVLQPVAEAGLDARAAWLDGERLRWPGVTGEGRFRLYHSAAGTLAIEGGRLLGADGFVALDVVPARDDARLRWFGSGTELRLADASRVRDLLREQLLLVQEEADGRVLDHTGTQLAAALDALYPAALDVPLGARPADGRTDFDVWAPTARDVHLCLFDGPATAATRAPAMARDPGSGAWSARLEGNLAGTYYAFVADVHAPGVGLVRNRVTDPYSLGLTTDSARSYVADLDALVPEGWGDAPAPAPLESATDLAIYELHVRDFSIGDESVPAAHRGKYLAFTDAGSDGMRHLRALAQAGLTDVHLLPVFDIASVPETGCVTPQIPAAAPDSELQQAAVAAVKERDCFNWGYDPWHYTVPEGSYATDPADGGVRILEFRRMVQALHAAGLRVGMDVVYNHASASGQQAKAVLDRLVPGYYHRLDRNGNVERSTCCDNTATENAMMARLMTDSVATWAREYRIDSFRFDLMGHQPRAAMEALQKAVDAAAGRHVELLGEGWNFGEVQDGARFVQASQLALGGSGIATFSDRARDAARGGGAGDNGDAQVINQGWLTGLSYAPNEYSQGRHSLDELRAAADLIRVGLAGSLRDYELHTWQGPRVPLSRIAYGTQPAGYASAPGEVVNYVENHDNQTLFDLAAFKLPPATSRDDRARVQVLGAALVAFSQGIAYFHAGMEGMRSKSMDRNSFDSGDHFNRLDWTFRDNGFGAGLPPLADNRASWEWMQPRLADPRIAPRPRDIAFVRDAFLALLRVRASSTLFRLRRADDVQQRLRFFDTGPAQTPTLVVARLDGRGYPGARFDDIVYAINVAPDAVQVRLDGEQGKPYRLHPALAKGAPDARVWREARFDPRAALLTVPARAAVVFVTGN
jgi:pullulanase/glycogen debranching enzyme